jgi:hypothetical protein
MLTVVRTRQQVTGRRSTEPSGPPPLYELKGGPAAGMYPVFADINGELPKFVTVAQVVQLGDPGAHRIEHVYRQVPSIAIPILGQRAKRYQYLRTIDGDAARYTCPHCGTTTYHPDNIEQGFCDQCQDWTRIRRYATLRPAAGVALPAEWVGRWFVHDGSLNNMLAMRYLTGQPTGQFVRGTAGAHAELIEVRQDDPRPQAAVLL